MKHIFAKKSLGQNFLKSKEAIRLIQDASDPNALDIVLEVGPGKGILTEALLPHVAKVIAVEKDTDLIEYLKEKFATEIANGKLDLIEGDILEFDPTVLKTYTNEMFEYKIVANIPYYITGVLIRKFLEADLQPTRMVLMLQKEVAQRIVAKDEKESILSISVKAYGQPKYIKTVQAKYFSPAPKVDSAIILIDQISKKVFKENNIAETAFFEVVKTGFAHKRKMLAGNLKEVYKKNAVDAAFDSLNISPKVRAEDIPFEAWVELTKKLS